MAGNARAGGRWMRTSMAVGMLLPDYRAVAITLAAAAGLWMLFWFFGLGMREPEVQSTTSVLAISATAVAGWKNHFPIICVVGFIVAALFYAAAASGDRLNRQAKQG